jgi:hypothetical protein
VLQILQKRSSARDAAIGVIDLEGLRAFVGPARNASQLASAAHVLIMSAFRFLRQPARWIIRGDPQRQLSEALRSLPSRACLGLFAAADALGFGFVHGVPPHIYVEDLGPSGLRQMGLSAEVSGQPDVLLRLPSAPEAVFRGAVRKAGVQACDVIQMWLDVSAHPARGHEQAALVHRRILQPLLKHRRTTT